MEAGTQDTNLCSTEGSLYDPFGVFVGPDCGNAKCLDGDSCVEESCVHSGWSGATPCLLVGEIYHASSFPGFDISPPCGSEGRTCQPGDICVSAERAECKISTAAADGTLRTELFKKEYDPFEQPVGIFCPNSQQTTRCHRGDFCDGNRCIRIFSAWEKNEDEEQL